MDIDLCSQLIVSLLVFAGIAALCYFGIAGAVKKGVRDAGKPERDTRNDRYHPPI